MTNDQWGSPNKDDQNPSHGDWNADNSGADWQAPPAGDQPAWQSGAGWDGPDQTSNQAGGWQASESQPSADQWQQPADQSWNQSASQPSADQWQQPADQSWNQSASQPSANQWQQSADQSWNPAGSQPSAGPGDPSPAWGQPADQGAGWNQTQNQYGYEPTQGFQPQAPYGSANEVGQQASGFFSALFDFSFTKFVTPSIVKFMYVLVTIVVALYVVGMIIVGFTADSAVGIMMLIFAPIIGLVMLGLIRMQMEFMVAAVRTAENTSEMKEQLKNR